MDYAYLFKFLLIGDSRVGKSSLLSHFIDGSFGPLPATVGVEFASRCVVVDGVVIKLQVWDTAGQERFRSVTRSYYRGAAGALLVYDASRRDTFENVLGWLEDVETKCPSCQLPAGHGHGMAIALVANKRDLRHRAVPTEEGAAFAERHGLLFFEASAKTGHGVTEAFTSVARDVCSRVRHGTVDLRDGACGILAKQRTAPIVLARKRSACGPARCCV
mmetsp:Transcript_81123/g.219735  ORF Transcript_81123/g.219735 Transcript_81123/m.219735 type:complete len:218 (+) Transcript_81123:70-723(+)